MFKFLKDKLKETINKFSKKIDEEAEIIEIPVPKELKEKEISKEDERLKEKKKEVEEIVEKIKKEEEEKKEKKSIFTKIKETVTTKKISEEKFDELFESLDLTLLENNVAVEVIEKIKENLKKELVDKPLTRSKIEETVRETLKETIEKILIDSFDLMKKIKEKKEKPFVIVFVGINGSGKTTTIAKVAKLLQNNNLKPILAAADTFRAAAIQQLSEWGEKLKIPVVKGEYGADPASIGFDAVKMAKARNYDVVLIDTAGRLHSNQNLIDEMKKIIRVTKPDLKIFVGESITGNDCVEQAKKFNESINLDGIILSKADVDEKGGAAISISYVTEVPILYIGTGQSLDSLKPFKKEEIIKQLGL